MSTAAPPERASGPEGDAPVVPTDAMPAVVAVVVTRNPGPFLEKSLATLGAQDYTALSVLVVDAGSNDDPTARVGAVLPQAFVRRVEGDPGFGGAANEALAAVQGAAFFLVCHDDVELDPDTLRVMVEEAYRSNAAIVGPKLVSVENPDVILEVGRAIDRLGGTHTGIEPGELDQEQHDAVRDVFYVSSAAMLVRADLFQELDGFDPDVFPGSEDLDLCWRALLAGARVMVAPDARGRHHQASSSRTDADRANARDVARHRVRVVMTCSSGGSLLLLIPLGLAVSFVETIAFALTRRRTEAFAGFGAWWWNLLHFGRLRAARQRAQALRQVQDRELRGLQVGATARFGAFLSHHNADERMYSIGERGRNAIDTFGDMLRHPASLALLALMLLLVVGSSGLLFGDVPAIGSFAPWPGIGSLFTELTSAWRHTGMGSTAAAPPVFALMASIGTLLFGSMDFALAVVITGAFLLGAFGAFRLARAVDAGYGGSCTAAVAYGVSAVPRNAVAAGRLGPLVLYALAPFLALLVIRAGRFPGLVGTSRRPVLGLVIVTAVAAAWYPPAALVGVAVALALVVAALVAGGGASAFRGLGAAIAGLAGAALLLVPWTATLFDVGSDRASLGLVFHSDIGLAELAKFDTGPNGGGVGAWGLLVAALAALVIVSGPRLAWVARAWALALLGFAVVLLPAELAPNSATAAPEAGLSLAALGVALAAGLAVSATGERMAHKKIGWAQIVGFAAAAGIVLASLGFLGDVFDGQWHAPESWSPSLAFTQDRIDEGQYRVLWVGDPAVLPLGPVAVDDTLSWTMTRNGPGDARELLRAPVKDADEVIGRALRAARSGSTSRLGRILAPAGVRYIAMPTRIGPAGARGRVPPGIARALAAQLDFARLGSERGLVLYENQSWAPARAQTDADVPTGVVDPLRSAAATDLTGAKPIHSTPVSAGTSLLAEAHDDGWSASAGDKTLAHERAFGFTNAWKLPDDGVVSFQHDGQTKRYGLLGLELALWVVALVWWSRGRRAAARTRASRSREERRRQDALFESLGDDFWEDV
jgi:GT2 family glycosyltransferase